MNFIKKWWDRYLINKRLKEIDIDKKILDSVKNTLNKTEITTEKTEACQHKELIQILEKDAWYQCKKCKMIFFLEGIPGWTDESFDNLIGKFIKELEIEQEDKCKKKKK